MKVILTSHIKGFGQKGDIKEVSDGYFQNFLAPRKLATKATTGSVSHVLNQKTKAVEKLENMKESANAVKERVHGKTCNLTERCSEGGKLYAAIHEKEIRLAIKEQLGADIPEKQIKMEAIKSTGSFNVELELYKDIKAKVQIIITAA